MDVISQFFKALPRQGPGNDAFTRRALMSVKMGLDNVAPRILDLGCGTGASTMVLASYWPEAEITAIDLNPHFLQVLQQHVQKQALQERIQVLEADFSCLPSHLGHFDLIWSEGAIYHLGFREGLQYWRSFLRPQGCLGVSEVTWVSDSPSPEALAYWQQHYPGIADLGTHFLEILDVNFELLDTIVLPETVWWSDYYHPIQNALKRCDTRLDEVQALKAQLESEIHFYQRYSAEYSYVFFVMQSLS